MQKIVKIHKLMIVEKLTLDKIAQRSASVWNKPWLTGFSHVQSKILKNLEKINACKNIRYHYSVNHALI